MSVEKEIKELARVIAGISRHSEENDPGLDRQLEKIEKIISAFNKKYPELTLKLESTIDNQVIRVMFNGTVKEIYDECASKIIGLVSVGLTSFDEATREEADKFNGVVGNIKESVYITYNDHPETRSIILVTNEKEGKPELYYEIKSLADELSPQSQLMAFYMKKRQGEDADILTQMYELGFIDLEDEALFDWQDEFWPKMLD